MRVLLGLLGVVLLGLMAGLGAACGAGRSKSGAAGHVTLAGLGSLSPGPDAGRMAPSFSFPEVRAGRPAVSVSGAEGRPVLVNFWSSSCLPCRAELPTLEAAHRRLGDRLELVGVDEEDPRADARRLLTATGVTYPSAYDPDGSLADRYQLRGLPTTVFIASSGRVVGRVEGPLDPATLDGLLTRLTAA